MTDLFQWSEARKRADSGMRTALDHAESVTDDWGAIAYRFLVAYARSHDTFTSEAVTSAARDDATFPRPPTDRAWGAIFKRAARNSVIVQCGIGKRARGNMAPCPLYRSAVIGGGAEVIGGGYGRQVL